jgi:hypothetical protein
MDSNTYIENKEEESKLKAETTTKSKKKSNKSLVKILSGDFLSEKTLVDNLPFVGFVGFLLIVLIGWGYYTESIAKEEARLEKALGELNSEYFTLGSEYNRLSRQTQVANRLKDTGLTESVDPPKKIKVKKYVFK